MKASITVTAVLAFAGTFWAPAVAHAAGCSTSSFTSNNWVLDVQGEFGASQSVVSSAEKDTSKHSPYTAKPRLFDSYLYLGSIFTLSESVDYSDIGVVAERHRRRIRVVRYGEPGQSIRPEPIAHGEGDCDFQLHAVGLRLCECDRRAGVL